MERDPAARLRRAVKENNLFLVKRLIERIDMRNPDPGPTRYTSLAWAAVLGHEETFECLLAEGHDDQELSRDSENNTILLLLADVKPQRSTSFGPADGDIAGASLRMARMYVERYPEILDWSNSNGKTALHVAALKGKEDFVAMLCELGADIDLPDNVGNTPLHYASAWNHIPVVQLLIERGCQYNAANNKGFTPSDYAYSFSTRETLQDTARLQYEFNKKARRVFAQAAARGAEHGGGTYSRNPGRANRLRSGSAASYGQSSGSDSDFEGTPAARPHYSRSNQPSNFHMHGSASSSTSFLPSSMYRNGASVQHSLHNPASALTPIATRTLQQDADAMEKYMRRNRSGSASTDIKSQYSSNPSSAGPSANGDDISSLPLGSVAPRRKLLRPSASAAQLRTPITPPTATTPTEGVRTRSGTNPISVRANPPTFSPPIDTRALPTHIQTRGQLRTNATAAGQLAEEPESYTGPPSEYAKFPGPPPSKESLTSNGVPLGGNSTPLSTATTTPTSTRRLPFNLLSKPLPSIDQAAGHRRGSSSHSIR